MKKTLALLFVLALLFAGCNNDSPPVGEPSGGGQGQEHTGGSNYNRVDLTPGSMITIGNWELTPISYAVVETIDQGNTYFPPQTDGNMFVVPKFRVKNTGTTVDYVVGSYQADLRIDAKLVYQEVYEYEARIMIGLDGELQSDDFQPLVEQDGQMAYELPPELAQSGELAFVLIADGTEYWFNLTEDVLADQ